MKRKLAQRHLTRVSQDRGSLIWALEQAQAMRFDKARHKAYMRLVALWRKEAQEAGFVLP